MLPCLHTLGITSIILFYPKPNITAKEEQWMRHRTNTEMLADRSIANNSVDVGQP